MILCLDVGNTNILGGVFVDDRIVLRFRHDTSNASTSDQLGIFLKNVLRENGIIPEKISKISICSVVTTIDYSLNAACIKYFNITPFYLKNGVITGINNLCDHPEQVGADLIAGAIASTTLYPCRDTIIFDLGTATTLAALSQNKEYLGTIILPGIKIAMQSLQTNTAKLTDVAIAKPNRFVGKNTVESIQSGLYYGHLSIIKNFIKLASAELFANKTPLIIGTGGFSSLFRDENCFDIIEPDLILHGLKTAFYLNINKS